MTPILVPCVLCPRNEHEIQSVWASNGELRWWPGELAAVSLWDSRCVSPAQGTFCLSAPLLCCDPTLVAQTVKNLSAYNAGDPDSIPGSKRRLWQPTPVLLPGESPGTENPGVLQSMGLQRFRHDWATNTHKITLWIGKAGVSLSLSLSLTHTHTHTHKERADMHVVLPSICTFPTTPISFPWPRMVYFDWFTKTRNLSLFYFEALSLSVLRPQAWFTWDCSLRLLLHWGEFPHDIHVRLFPFGSFHLSPLFPWLRLQQ